jgi:hypothetical protein
VHSNRYPAGIKIKHVYITPGTPVQRKSEKKLRATTILILETNNEKLQTLGGTWGPCSHPGIGAATVSGLLGRDFPVGFQIILHGLGAQVQKSLDKRGLLPISGTEW